MPFGLTPHLGHLALVTATVVGVVVVTAAVVVTDLELGVVTVVVVVVLTDLLTVVATAIAESGKT